MAFRLGPPGLKGANARRPIQSLKNTVCRPINIDSHRSPAHPRLIDDLYSSQFEGSHRCSAAAFEDVSLAECSDRIYDVQASHVLHRCFNQDSYRRQQELRSSHPPSTVGAPKDSVDLLKDRTIWGQLSEVFVLLFGEECPENEVRGVYTLRTFTPDNEVKETVVAFQSISDAERFANLLVSTMDHLPSVHSIKPSQLAAGCAESGYNCQLEVSGTSLIPPGYTVTMTDWERALRLRSGEYAVLHDDPHDRLSMPNCSINPPPSSDVDPSSYLPQRANQSLHTSTHGSAEHSDVQQDNSTASANEDIVDTSDSYSLITGGGLPEEVHNEANGLIEKPEAEAPEYNSLTPFLEEQVALFYASMVDVDTETRAEEYPASNAELLSRPMTLEEYDQIRSRLSTYWS